MNRFPRLAPILVIVTMGAAAVALDQRAALSVLEIFAPVGAASAIAAAAVGARGRRSGALPPLRRQFLLIGGIALAEIAVTLALAVKLMFVSYHDAVWAVLVTVWGILVALAISWPWAREALDDLEAIRNALARVGDGERDLHIAVRSGSELAGLARDLKQTVNRLEAEESARRRLLAAVSHDLRTPITSLQLMADALEDELVEPEMQHIYLRRMGTHVRALSALIDDLFELSRLEAGDVSWSLERVHVGPLVHEAVEAMRAQADAGDVRVTADVRPDLSPAEINPEHLQRVLFNLIQNAIRHTPADGGVVVRAEPTDHGVELEVADDGEGIAGEERSRIFEPFVQGASRGQARSNGSAGLGLAIARAIVEAHGGRIWLDDADVGTRVRFTLPGAA